MAIKTRTMSKACWTVQLLVVAVFLAFLFHGFGGLAVKGQTNGSKVPTTGTSPKVAMARPEDLQVSVAVDQTVHAGARRVNVIAYARNVARVPVRVYAPALVGPFLRGPGISPRRVTAPDFGEGNFVILGPDAAIAGVMECDPAEAQGATAAYRFFAEGHEGEGKFMIGVLNSVGGYRPLNPGAPPATADDRLEQ